MAAAAVAAGLGGKCGGRPGLGGPAGHWWGCGRAPAAPDWLQRPADREAEFVHLAVPTDHPRGAYLVLRRRPSDDGTAVLAALQMLAPVVAGRLSQQRLATERDARQRMSLLSELLQSGGRLAPDAPRRMLDQGWTLDGWHIGVRIDVPSALDPVALLPEIQRAFADAGVGAQVVEHGEGWAAWTTFTDQPSQAVLQTHAATVRRVQWLLRSKLPTVMGVGSVQSGPEGLVRSLGEAGDAARIAVTRAAGGHLVHVDRLGVGQLLLAWTRTDTFAPAASSLLTPLQGQAGLLETLAAYLEAESSLADTAAVLGVHRNTVSARIARAVDLLGVDLDDPDERLALQLACRSVLSHR
ncbi:MAG: helix-turn-helix domain-containing protein [Nakamurella sp.]